MKLKRALSFIYCFLITVYFEFAIKLFTVGSFDARFIYTALFCIPVASLIYIPMLLSGKALSKVIYNIIIAVIAVYFSVQLVYYAIFGSYLSVSLMGMGGAAVTNFSAQLISAIRSSVLGLVALILPVIVTVVLTATGLLCFKKPDADKKRAPLVVLSLAIVMHFLCLVSLMTGGTGEFTVYGTYHSSETGIDTRAQNLGIFVATRLEVQNMLSHSMGLAEEEVIVVPEDNIKEDAVIPPDEYNALDIDFNRLVGFVEKGTAEEVIAGTVSWRGATKKNEYTGMLEGCNLITICAEAFSPYLIDEELTPTLYKLSSEGFIFNNYYGSFESVTTDGEYAFCLGMFPDMTRWSGDSSFMEAEDNSLPFALGNMFDSIGVKTYAYHNYYSSYYSRDITHPNMGYKVFKTPGAGLDMEVGWPSSDLEMFKLSVDDYVGSGEQFHAYYMTFAGHYQYNWDNPMSAKHRDKVEHLDYSDGVKAYIACNLDLEYALAYLMERLEEAGIADETVIVLTNDHYPYGLTAEQYNELAGEEIDTDFEKYRNSFICWKGGMEEAVQVDKYCSTVDILPTILNLFGFDFDSRFVIGRDVLSDHEGIAILANKSFITEDYRFNAVDNELVMTTDKEISEKEIEEKKALVNGTLGLSRTILNTDFYQYYVAYMNSVADGGGEETELSE